MHDLEYNLSIEPDTNTRCHMHWFYFQLTTFLPKCNKNLPLIIIVDTKIRINIMNYLRGDSIYTQGMKPIVKRESNPDLGWHRDHTIDEISYQETS